MTTFANAPRSRYAASRVRHAEELWRGFMAPERLPQLDRWLAAELKQHRGFGKNDRRAYSEILFACVRFGYLAAFLEFAADRLPPAEPTALRPLLRAALEAFATEYPDPAAALAAVKALAPPRLFQWVGRRYRAEGLDWPLPLETNPEREGLFEAMRLMAVAGELSSRLVWQGVPLWYLGPLQRRAEIGGWSGAPLGAFLEAQSTRPPLWLRLNHRQRRAELLRELQAAGLTARPLGDALEVAGERGIYELNGYRQGWFEIQDLASQGIGLAVAAAPGELVWDACAGGGGKTMQLAAMLENRGAVYASDIREYKLKEVRRRSARAGFDNVRCFVWTGEAAPPLSPEVRKRGGFHRVLVDAPCSSSGTWRRNPDARYRLHATALAELIELQGRLLAAAAPAVRPGGTLVYSTCSWLVEENEAVVDGFLRCHPDFTLEHQSALGCPERNADSMFAAVLRRHG